MPSSRYDPETRRWETAIPLPYWKRPWWRLFRLSPHCLRCHRTFSSQYDWGSHWLAYHKETDNA